MQITRNQSRAQLKRGWLQRLPTSWLLVLLVIIIGIGPIVTPYLDGIGIVCCPYLWRDLWGILPFWSMLGYVTIALYSAYIIYAFVFKREYANRKKWYRLLPFLIVGLVWSLSFSSNLTNPEKYAIGMPIGGNLRLYFVGSPERIRQETVNLLDQSSETELPFELWPDTLHKLGATRVMLDHHERTVMVTVTSGGLFAYQSSFGYLFQEESTFSINGPDLFAETPDYRAWSLKDGIFLYQSD